MCEPATIIAATTAIIGAYSQYEQGQAAEATAKYNARLQDNDAERMRNKSVEEENAHRMRVATMMGKQRAAFGASGVDVNSGSAFQIQNDTQTLGDADALRIRSNYEDQASHMNRQADLTRIEGKNAARAGKVGAIGSILSGAGEIAGSGVADKWLKPTSAAKKGVKHNFYNMNATAPSSFWSN